MRNLIEENNAKRVVIDSITHLAEALGGEEKIREFVFELGLQLSYMDTTMILISEIPPQKFVYSVFGVEEFIADGVILLTEFERKGDLIRALQVIKMRGVDHSRSKHILKITEEGVNLIPLFKAGIV
jgi:circadian clock protein KaiC